jgi:hypothetical protein
MDDKSKEQINLILGLLHLHEALIAVLYADHIEHDKKLRDVTQNAQQSLAAFRNYVNHYLEGTDPKAEHSSTQVASEGSADFFRIVEAVLARRGKLGNSESPSGF